MAAYQHTTIDGQRVEKCVADAFVKMRNAFGKAFPGITLKINSGTRTTQEQEAIFRARYVLSSGINGRRVYDTRWWNGRLWYRISSAGTVAQPGTSNHEEGGPNGPRSLDIRDTGSDRGVMYAGTTRDRWMLEHAHEFGFENEGNSFGERWHKTFRGTIGKYGSSGSTSGSSSSKRPNPWTVVRGWSWKGVAAMLRRYYGYVGNNTPGPVMMRAFQRFLRKYGYTGPIDGIYGDGTAKAHQRWLKARYRYTGGIDAWMGAGSKAAHGRANSANWAAFPSYRR